MRLTVRLLCFGMALLLSVLSSGCGHTPVTQTVFDATGLGKSSVDAIKLNPKMRYLRVSTPERVVLMVLGYADPVPQGVLETWYSSEGEVLKLLNGRLVSSVGLDLDWRSVRYSNLPAWSQTIGKSEVRYSRVRDEMPGYRFGIEEALKLYEVDPPGNSRLQDMPANALRWFEERVVTVKATADLAGLASLPSARYAIGYKEFLPVVMYGEQCLAQGRCISWQPWPSSF